MRKVAAIADVHGNPFALDAVLDEVRRESVDLVVFCGDVAAGPMPAAVIDRVQALDLPVRHVSGNCEREMVQMFDTGQGPGPFITWPAAQITEAQRDFLASFERAVEVEVDGLGRVCFCHATPSSDMPTITAATPDDVVLGLLTGTEAPVVAGGHTHMQFDRLVGERRMVNVGSAGLPYEDEPGAYWALFGPDVSLRRTVYDFEAAQAAVLATGFPDREDFARGVARPVSPAEATAHFERRAGRGEP